MSDSVILTLAVFVKFICILEDKNFKCLGIGIAVSTLPSLIWRESKELNPCPHEIVKII